MSTQTGWTKEALDAFVRIHYTVELDQWESFMTNFLTTPSKKEPGLTNLQAIVEKNYEIIRMHNPFVYCIITEGSPSKVAHLSFQEFEKVISGVDTDMVSWWPDAFRQKEECLEWLAEEINTQVQLTN